MDPVLPNGNRGSSRLPCVGASLVAFVAALAGRVDGFHRVKCIAERNLVDVLGVRVLLDRRIDEEGYWHVDGLTWFERLLIEAEALDFLEIFADLVGADVVCRLRRDRPCREICRAIKNLGQSARLYRDLQLLGLETPRK